MPYARRRGFWGTDTCRPADLPACSTWDTFQYDIGLTPSNTCLDAIDACNGISLNLTPGGSLPPGAGPISTPTLVQQTVAPTGANVAPDAASAFTAYQAAVAAANPPSSTSFFDLLPTWAWAAIAALGLLAVLK